MPKGHYARDYGRAVCPNCGTGFTRKMQGQRFCKPECREASKGTIAAALHVLDTLEEWITQQRAQLTPAIPKSPRSAL